MFDTVSYLLGRKKGRKDSLLPSDEGKVVRDGALVAQAEGLHVTSNGSHDTTYVKSVDVEVLPRLQEKEALENGAVLPDEGYDGLGRVTVSVPGPRLQTKSVAENGTVVPDDGYDGMSSIEVSVPGPRLQEKTTTANGQIVPDGGYDGLSSVEVAVPGPRLQTKSVAENGTVVPDDGYDGMSSVTVAVPVETVPFAAGGGF